MNKMQATHAIGVYSIRQETIYTLYTRIIYVRGEITRHGSAANGIADITRQKIGCAQAKRAHEMPGIAGNQGLLRRSTWPHASRGYMEDILLLSPQRLL